MLFLILVLCSLPVCRSSSCCWYTTSVTPEQGSTQWCLLSCRCSGTGEKQDGQIRRGDQTTLERSPASPFLLLKECNVCISAPWNEMSAPRKETRGLPCLQICVNLCFYPCFPYVAWLLIKSQSFKYCMLCLCSLVTRLSNAKMVDKSWNHNT